MANKVKLDRTKLLGFKLMEAASPTLGQRCGAKIGGAKPAPAAKLGPKIGVIKP